MANLIHRFSYCFFHFPRLYYSNLEHIFHWAFPPLLHLLCWLSYSIIECWKSSKLSARFSFSSVQFSCSVLPDSLQPHGLQYARLHCPPRTPRAYSNSSTLSQWCHQIISSSVVPFFSCLQSFPALGSFQMSQFFASGGQSIRVSASASLLEMNIQDWSPLGWTGLISLQSKGLSRVFSNTRVQKHQFFGAQLSL